MTGMTSRRNKVDLEHLVSMFARSVCSATDFSGCYARMSICSSCVYLVSPSILLGSGRHWKTYRSTEDCLSCRNSNYDYLINHLSPSAPACKRRAECLHGKCTNETMQSHTNALNRGQFDQDPLQCAEGRQ